MMAATTTSNGRRICVLFNETIIILTAMYGILGIATLALMAYDTWKDYTILWAEKVVVFLFAMHMATLAMLVVSAVVQAMGGLND